MLTSFMAIFQYHSRWTVRLALNRRCITSPFKWSPGHPKPPVLHTLWLCQKSYWSHGHRFIVDFPIDSMVIFHSCGAVYQRVVLLQYPVCWSHTSDPLTSQTTLFRHVLPSRTLAFHWGLQRLRSRVSRTARGEMYPALANLGMAGVRLLPTSETPKDFTITDSLTDRMMIPNWLNIYHSVRRTDQSYRHCWS